jgi:hypothetical protein
LALWEEVFGIEPWDLPGEGAAESEITGISGSGSGVNTRSDGTGVVALVAASVTVSLSAPLVIVACIKEIAAITVAPTIPVAAATETIVLFLFMTQPCQSER